MSGRISPLAGKPVDPSRLIDVSRLVSAYFSGVPDPSIASQRVRFGTSGHRGSAFDNSFNEAHVLAIAQAICLYRQTQGIGGPLYVGIDTHALSAGAGDGPGGLRRQRRDGDGRRRRRLHADARGLARDPGS